MEQKTVINETVTPTGLSTGIYYKKEWSKSQGKFVMPICLFKNKFRMKKVLYVSFKLFQNSGGKQCSDRNLASIEHLCGKENVFAYYLTFSYGQNKILAVLRRLIDIFQFYMAELTPQKERVIYDLIKKYNCDIVFIDSSMLGKLSKGIKKYFPEVEVTVFFHNCEYKFCTDSIIVRKKYLRFYQIILAYLNEKQAMLYADKVISLNKRDSEALNRIYHREVDAIIPISIKDTCCQGEEEQFDNDVKTGLFVGSYFFANVQGLKWFIHNVLPFVDIRLNVVGSGMDHLIEELPELSDKVSVFSNVADLTPYYNSADFVILPILSGSGMKVKTAESLMYGKFLIGTKEAFTGYDLNEVMSVECNTSEEFINAVINFVPAKKYNVESRRLFLSKYSFDSTLPLFADILEL